MRWHFHFLLALCGLVNATGGSAQDSKPENVVLSAKEAQRRAVQFFSEKVAVHGGYVYQVSEDLRYREGEGDAEKHAVWVQPPGTPAVGMAYVMLTSEQRRSISSPPLAQPPSAWFKANCIVVDGRGASNLNQNVGEHRLIGSMANQDQKPRIGRVSMTTKRSR